MIKWTITQKICANIFTKQFNSISKALSASIQITNQNKNHGSFLLLKKWKETWQIKKQ